jgi:undecaprenyl phosphate-alpha-L-ara4N flippase subunit ArnE
MPLWVLGLIGVCVTMETAEQVLLRMAGRHPKRYAYYASPAIALNLVGLAGWLVVLRFAPLGQALPLLAANNIAVAAAGRILFGERVSVRRWVGVVLITAGMVLVAGYAP